MEMASGEGPCPRAALQTERVAGRKQLGRVSLVRKGLLELSVRHLFSIPPNKCRPANLAKLSAGRNEPQSLLSCLSSICCLATLCDFSLTLPGMRVTL